jgi:hypothetical protein
LKPKDEFDTLLGIIIGLFLHTCFMGSAAFITAIVLYVFEDYEFFEEINKDKAIVLWLIIPCLLIMFIVYRTGKWYKKRWPKARKDLWGREEK